MNHLSGIAQRISSVHPNSYYGKILSVKGSIIESTVPYGAAGIGHCCTILDQAGSQIGKGEVIGFNGQHIIIVPYFTLRGISPGNSVFFTGSKELIYPHLGWQGRIIDGFAHPIDGLGSLSLGHEAIPIRSVHSRGIKNKVDQRMSVGIKSINTFMTCCRGQRMGIFAGSGVGKSMLLSMLAKYADCDIAVIGLIGERGREVREFVEDTLGPEGLKKSIVVVATSDESPLLRKRASLLTMAIAEYFRDLGKNVLCLFDSVTRFAHAQREIGLGLGEMPTTRGYTPSVFFEMSKLLERSGPNIDGKPGSITSFFTVLVEGDDMNEPISDAVRGTLDGHIILDRRLAELNIYPAINVLRSISRTVPGCHSMTEQDFVKEFRKYLSLQEEMADFVRLGAYIPGSDATLDKSLSLKPAMESFLMQLPGEYYDMEDSFDLLKNLLSQS